MRKSAEEVQWEYYRRTASRYDDAHVSDEDEHFTALRHISGFINFLPISSVLDVGCGTGRGVKYFLEKHPAVRVIGIEPVQGLLARARAKGIPHRTVISGSAYSMPFKDASFDAVCAFAVLHHVRYPTLVVKEMLRIARKAVFLSDSNRFGHGSKFQRVLKFLLYKGGLWGIANYLKTGGKGYTISEEDGLAYSYSVYDSYELLADWAERVVLIPTRGTKDKSWYHPLFTSDHILLCAIRDKVSQIP